MMAGRFGLGPFLPCNSQLSFARTGKVGPRLSAWELVRPTPFWFGGPSLTVQFESRMVALSYLPWVLALRPQTGALTLRHLVKNHRIRLRRSNGNAPWFESGILMTNRVVSRETQDGKTVHELRGSREPQAGPPKQQKSVHGARGRGAAVRPLKSKEVPNYDKTNRKIGRRNPYVACRSSETLEMIADGASLKDRLNDLCCSTIEVQAFAGGYQQVCVVMDPDGERPLGIKTAGNRGPHADFGLPGNQPPAHPSLPHARVSSTERMLSDS